MIHDLEDEELFTLILTRKEAAVLRTIMRKISGNSVRGGPRVCTDQINADLQEMDIGYYDYDPEHKNANRSINLPDGWNAMGPEITGLW